MHLWWQSLGPTGMYPWSKRCHKFLTDQTKGALLNFFAVANLHTYSHWVKSSEVEESESQNKSIVLNLTIGSKNNTIKYNFFEFSFFPVGQWILSCMHFPLGRWPKDPRAVSATQSGSGSSTEKKYFYFLKARLSHFPETSFELCWG